MSLIAATALHDRLCKLAFRLNALKSIFITHQHSDHNLDYGNLFYFAWYSSLRKPVDSYGPPPLAEMTKKVLRVKCFRHRHSNSR